MPQRTGLRAADLQRLTALVRGGATWEQARAVLRDVSPAVVERFKEAVLLAAAEPGPAEKLPAPPTTEEEREQLDAWVAEQRRDAGKPRVLRSVGRSRR